VRSSVDLPLPDAPSTASSSPGAASSVTSAQRDHVTPDHGHRARTPVSPSHAFHRAAADSNMSPSVSGTGVWS
jgi:hypothetical protein